MPRKSVRVFLGPEALKLVKSFTSPPDMTFSQALDKLVRAGAKVLMGRKEDADGTDRR